MQIKITTTTTGNPPGKVADAELHFTEGPLAGLKLIGFGIWERRTGNGYNVTFPARSYSVNGERRSFALLRPAGGDISAQETIRQLIISAYEAHQDGQLTDAPIGTLPQAPPTPIAPKRETAPTPTAAPFDF